MTKKICYCNDVDEDDIRRAIRDKGLTTTDEIAVATGAAAGCATCLPDVEEILADELEQQSDKQG